jgi:hypothetical protein
MPKATHTHTHKLLPDKKKVKTSQSIGARGDPLQSPTVCDCISIFFFFLTNSRRKNIYHNNNRNNFSQYTQKRPCCRCVQTGWVGWLVGSLRLAQFACVCHPMRTKRTNSRRATETTTIPSPDRWAISLLKKAPEKRWLLLPPPHQHFGAGFFVPYKKRTCASRTVSSVPACVVQQTPQK